MTFETQIRCRVSNTGDSIPAWKGFRTTVQPRKTAHFLPICKPFDLLYPLTIESLSCRLPALGLKWSAVPKLGINRRSARTSAAGTSATFVSTASQVRARSAGSSGGAVCRGHRAAIRIPMTAKAKSYAAALPRSGSRPARSLPARHRRSPNDV